MSTTLERPGIDRHLDHLVNSSPFLRGRQLRVEHEHGRVTLHGTVTSFFHKQMAQEALRRIDGVEAIDNQLEVIYPLPS